ncbi:hypothetical protein K501DRAFT_336677 [Backusella circina FSU 941]|nr:hypothetical protein K501DRAFT_336677 [Backusella circina FSU 941]
MEQTTETESVGSYSSALPSNTSSISNKVPTDKIHLVFLLITGSKASFEFEPSLKIVQVKNFLFEHWPKDWVKEVRPISIQYLEIVYLGKFLGNDTTLQENKLSCGQTTTIHLIIRQNKHIDVDGRSIQAKKCCIIL